jgi:hypothetical protein
VGGRLGDLLESDTSQTGRWWHDNLPRLRGSGPAACCCGPYWKMIMAPSVLPRERCGVGCCSRGSMAYRCCVTSGQAHERESAGRQLLRAYERSCSHTIHVLMGGMARSSKFSAFGPMIMNAWMKQGMNPNRWLNQDCSTTADMV